MPKISGSVGDGGTNAPQDVAIVQLMLRLVKTAKQQSYLATTYSGNYDAATKSAIIAFQTDAKLLAAAAAKAPQPGLATAPQPGLAKAPGPALQPAAPKQASETKGLIRPGSATFTKLAGKLPAGYQDIRALPATPPTIYKAATAEEAQKSASNIGTDPELEPIFRSNVVTLVQRMHQQYGIALWLTPTGSRRTFAQQAAEVNTKAGPGESNHNFGRAVDIGFNGITWLHGDGTSKKDVHWLNALQAASPAKARAFWDTRDQIANALTLYPLNFERVHLQAFKQANVSSGRSLATLLNKVGQMKWDATYPGGAWRYQSNLGVKGGTLHTVGTAKEIWATQATVTKKMLAEGWTKEGKGKKVWKEGDVKAEDLVDYKQRLKAEFQRADTGWIHWKAVP